MHCRICKSERLMEFLDLGNVALANSYLRKEDLDKPEFKAKLDVWFCQVCGLVQLGTVVPPETLFRHYLYYSSNSSMLMRHFSDYADEIAGMHADKRKAFVVEIASNDGILIKNFKRHGIRFLGIDPAENIAKKANAEGIPTIAEFFNSKSATAMEKEHGKATAILGNNVFAHIDDIHDVIDGVEALLSEDGFLALEFPYLVNLLENTEFDTIYHEHLSYFSIHPLVQFFAMHKMEIFDVRRTSIHGGSVRLFIQRQGGPRKVTPSVVELLELEKQRGIMELKTYQHFAENVERLKVKLVSLLTKLKKEGKSIAAYGAPAKGNTLLCYCGVDTKFLDFTVDRSPYKQNLYTPGMHLPIYSPEALLRRKPDYTLILAWNFASEIMKQQEGYAKSGGKFIIPIPSPKIVRAP
ncbi:MAG: class I SAM-dependent methyltransferase [Candidatus Micrarchaeota archaeon]